MVSQYSTFLCDNNFPDLVAPLFSWRCLAASISSFHYATMNRRFSIPRYAKRPDVALLAIDPLFLLPTPSSPHCTLEVSNTIRFDSRPPLIRMCVPAHKKSLLVHNVVSMLSARVISRARLYEVIRWSGLLRCAPLMRSKTP